MLYFTLVIIILLIALRMIVGKTTAKLTAKPTKGNTLTRHENAIGRATDRMGW